MRKSGGLQEYCKNSYILAEGFSSSQMISQIYLCEKNKFSIQRQWQLFVKSNFEFALVRLMFYANC
jgi:hypothetical protein